MRYSHSKKLLANWRGKARERKELSSNFVFSHWYLLKVCSLGFLHYLTADMFRFQLQQDRCLCETVYFVLDVGFVLRELMAQLPCNMANHINIVDDLNLTKHDYATNMLCPVAILFVSLLTYAKGSFV